MSYPQATGLRIAFYSGLAISSGFVVLYVSMLGGLVGSGTGYSRVKWNGVGASGLVHALTFMTLWVMGACGCIGGSGDCFMVTMMMFAAMWVLGGITFTALGAFSGDVIGVFMYYVGITTLAHIVATVGIFALIFVLDRH